MVSVPTTHLVLFIASVAVAAGVAGAFTAESSRMSATIEEVGVDVSDEVQTDIEIISDGGSQVYDDETGNITLAVQNLGDSTPPHDVDQVDVFLDGTYQTASDLTISVQDASSWAPDEVVEIVISAPDLAGGDHRVKVVVDGDAEVFEFRTCTVAEGRTRLIFEEANNDDELAMINRSGDIEQLGVKSKGFSEVAADFDCDGLLEAAFSKDGDPNGDTLHIVDRNGEVEQIADVKVHDRRLAVGDLDGDGAPEIIFANRDDGDKLYRIEYGGSPQIIQELDGDDIDVRGIGGVADFNGDGDLDLVFLDGDTEVAYLDDGTVTSTGVKANEDDTIGSPADFDGDGEVRVPIITESASNPIGLVNSAGDTLSPPGQQSGMADKGSLATMDWDEDGDPDVLFRNKDENDELWRIDADGNMAAVVDSDGSTIEISDDGVA